MPLPGREGGGSLAARLGTGGALPKVPIGGGALGETGGGARAGTTGTVGGGVINCPGSGTGFRVPVEASPGSGGTSRALAAAISASLGLFAAKSQISRPSCDTASRPSEPQASAEERSRL